MKTFKRYNEAGIPEGMVIGIGAFDGLHMGHREVVREVCRRAGAAGAATGVLTFTPHPHAVLEGRHRPNLLCTDGEKAKLLDEMGLSVLILQEFDRAFSRLHAAEFIERVLVGALRPAHVVVGHDFRFGFGGSGTVDLLNELGAAAGFGVTVIPEVKVDGRPVRSSRIRQLIAAGDVAAAQRFLGRAYGVSGIVKPGKGAGRRLGFPTINIDPPAKMIPPEGVYAGQTLVEGVVWPSAIHIGFGGGGMPVIEAHLLGSDADLYGRTVEIRFLRRLRPARKFDDPGELSSQIAKDVIVIKQMLGLETT